LKILQAMSAAIVDQTASVLTTHFAQFIFNLYVREHPFILSPSALGTVSSRRRLRHGSVPHSRAVDHDFYAPTEDPTPIVPSPPAPSPPFTEARVRSSERIRNRVGRGGVAVGLRGRQ
jgi:hypothetical protein